MEKIRRAAGLEGGAAGMPGNGAGGAAEHVVGEGLGAALARGRGNAGGLSPQGAMPGGSDGAAEASLANALAGNSRGGLPGGRNGGRKDISPRGTAVGGALPGAQAQKIALSRAQNAALLAAAPMWGGDPAGQAVKQARKRR